MSHFTTVQTQIRDALVLRKLIKELGYNLIDNTELKGFAGQMRHVDFQIEVKKGYNIGFRKVNDVYTILGDSFMNSEYKTMVSSILQGYASKVVMRNVEAMGYATVKRTVDKDNTIKIVLVKR